MFREIQKLASIASKPGQFGENQSGDSSAAQVFQHPLRFRVM
jgi:hypothetical protein